MKIKTTKLEGCLEIQPSIFNDERGYFFESFNLKKFESQTGQKINFVQDNESFSTKGVLRGLHMQVGEYAQAKLVRVLRGSVLDVVVDLRKGSPTFAEHFSINLTCENKKQLFVPRGFAHGFVVLSDTAVFSYKCDNYYMKESERGLIYNDSELNINWQLDKENLKISKKDSVLPNLKDLV